MGLFVWYNIYMKKLTTREQVLARSRAADDARMKALLESDGADEMIDKVLSQVDEEVEQDVVENEDSNNDA